MIKEVTDKLNEFSNNFVIKITIDE